MYNIWTMKSSQKKKATSHPSTCPINHDPATKIKTKKNKKRINKAETNLGRNEISLQQICKDITKRQSIVLKELDKGLNIVRSYPKTVTFFGSARLKPGNKYYEAARRLAKKCCQEGFAVITGGGPGIMQAGNQGSFESCGSAIGFNIELPFEQVANPYVTHGVDFHYFFTRKVSMTFSGEAYIFFPGGFGTLDEFFEIVTLVQTKKMPKVPIILYGTTFFGPLDKWIKQTLRNKHKTISKGDEKIYTLTDDETEIMRIIKKAKVRNTPQPTTKKEKRRK